MADILKAIVAIERVRFYKNEFGIVECSIEKVKEGEPKCDKFNRIIIKGTMPPLVEQDLYNITAEFVDDPKWGQQYNLQSIYTALEFGENDEIGQKKFLSSIFTPLQITNMYDALSNPFESLKKGDMQELIKIKGCGMDTAAKWINRFNEKINVAKIFTELEDYNLTNNMISRLMDRYKSPEVVIEKVKNNPYVLCNEVGGIGWKTADKIALEGGIEQYSIERISAYIVHYLGNRGQEGCSWITPDELMGALIEELGEDVPDMEITDSIHSLQEVLWWDEDKTKIGLKKYYNIEEKVAKELIRIKNAKSSITCTNWENSITELEKRLGWQYTDEQKAGIELGINNNVTVITGGAGSGKTSLVNGILEALKKYSFVQASLSGRAASRMSEVTGEEGYTIHRLLGFPLGEDNKGKFTFHDENKLEADIYIIDEVSMIDASLMYNLLRAIPDGAKVIFLGDDGQLESIGSGNVAHDMIVSNEIPTVLLTKIHRQAAKSGIITESFKVRKGEQLIAKDWVGDEIRGELKDLHLKCYSDSSNTYYEIMKAFSSAMSSDDFDIMQTQIIVPIKTRGAACTYELNNAVQELCNPADKKKREEMIFNGGKSYILRKGDKVINTVNNYKTNPAIFNGNIGIIKGWEFDEEEFEDVMIIDFMGIGIIKLPKKYWNNIELGYALTVHKCQGSEFNHVIFGFDFSAYSLLSREMVYTGITRAKKLCELIAQTGALRMAITKESANKKQTHLQQCLYDVAHPKLIF